MAKQQTGGPLHDGGRARTVIEGEALHSCQWHADGRPEAAPAIIAFLGTIGIPVVAGPVAADSLIPGLAVRDGMIVVDPATPVWPGDLLHEAGHLALTDPVLRSSLSAVSDDPGEEMAAIAWSWAAAAHLGLAAEVVFHAQGYRGGAASLAAGYCAGGTVGAPILAMYGMTAEPHRAAEQGIAAYPVMERWLR